MDNHVLNVYSSKCHKNAFFIEDGFGDLMETCPMQENFLINTFPSITPQENVKKMTRTVETI